MRLRLLAQGRAAGPCGAPALVGLRCVFGVGDPEGEVPFVPVYRMAWSLGQPGGLDEDSAHEFPAAELLASLQARATRRAWAMRLEAELEQTASQAGELHVGGPAEELVLLHEEELPGGGRRLTLGTGLAHAPEAVVRLAGEYVVRSGGEGGGVCVFTVGLTEYEYEG